MISIKLTIFFLTCYCIMEQRLSNNMKFILGVNITIACLGIFMIDKAYQIDKQVTDDVNDYIKNELDTKISSLVDDVVNEMKYKGEIKLLVDTELNKVVANVTSTAITNEMKSQVNQIVTSPSIMNEIKEYLKNNFTFVSLVANKLAADSTFVAAVKK